MTTTTQHIAVPPSAVFAAIGDPTTYPRWLVGAQRIRHVEQGWPREGTSFHHTVGVGPLHVEDQTTVVALDPPDLLELRAGVGLLGAAHVTFRLAGRDGGTDISIDEEPAEGVLRLTWRALGKPLMALGLWTRNEVSLQQLRAHLEGAGTPPP